MKRGPAEGAKRPEPKRRRIAIPPDLPEEVLEHEIMGLNGAHHIVQWGLTSKAYEPMAVRALRRLFEATFRSPITGEPLSVAPLLVPPVGASLADAARAYSFMGLVVRQCMRLYFRGGSFWRELTSAGCINAMATTPPHGDRVAVEPGFLMWGPGVRPGPEALAKDGILINGRLFARFSGSAIDAIDLDALWRSATEIRVPAPNRRHGRLLLPAVAELIERATGTKLPHLGQYPHEDYRAGPVLLDPDREGEYMAKEDEMGILDYRSMSSGTSEPA